MSKPSFTPAIAIAVMTMAAGQGASAKPAKAADVAKVELLQKATAVSLGNMAWESVTVSDVQNDPKAVKWMAKTPTGVWKCTAAPDGGNAYCDK